MTSGTFPAAVIAAAVASRVKWDVPASVCLAQWALESAWGSAMPQGSNNPFGIKAVGAEPSVSCRTREVIEGKSVEVTARFRAFGSLAEAFDAHGELLATAKPYAHARLVRHNAEAFARALTGVYATDPNYGSSLVALMSAHDLYAYDSVPPAPKPIALAPVITQAPKPPLTRWQAALYAITGKAA